MSELSKSAKVLIKFSNYDNIEVTGLDTINYGQAKYLEYLFRKVKQNKWKCLND